MSDMALLLCWSALQVTLLALATAFLYTLTCRRRPGPAASIVAAGLVGCGLLTLWALCPGGRGQVTQGELAVSALPGVEHANEASKTDTRLNAASTSGPAFAMSASSWLTWLSERLQQTAAGPTASGRLWRLTLVGLFLGGASLGLGRLLLGLWSVRSCLRRSRATTDPEVQFAIEKIQKESGCSLRVQVRESADLATAAAAGWRQPVILLPADWREWSVTELRAALAHEFAHVLRRDYLAGLLAQVGLALHYYHPLMHWLARRLHLEQELAADALAARCAGGQGSYLTALARLALRHERRPAAWLAASLFSKPGTLMRRIDMLWKEHAIAGSHAGRRTPWITVGLLAAVGLGLSAFPSPAQKDVSQARGDKPTADTKLSPQSGSFDLSYLPPGTPFVMALRPASLFNRPELASYKRLMDAGIQSCPQALNLPGKIRLSVSEIDQVVTRGNFQIDPKKKENPRSLTFSLHMIRCAHDFDWKAQMAEIFPSAEEVHHKAGVYYKVPKTDKPKPNLGGFVYYIPDGRTLLMESEEFVRLLLEGKALSGPKPAWLDAWHKMDKGLLVLALDRSAFKEDYLINSKDPLERSFIPIFEHASWLAFGMGGSGDACVEAVAQCPDPEATKKVFAAADDLLRQGRKALDAKANRSAETKDSRLDCFLRQLLASACLKCNGTQLEFHCEAKAGFDEVLKFVMEAPELGAEEATSPKKH
jgi:hypothetical protein